MTDNATLEKRVTKKGRSIETPFTDDQAHDKLGQLLQAGKVRGDFPEKLFAAYLKGRCSVDMVTWIHILVVESSQPKPAAGKNLSSLIAFFDAAKETGLKFPKVTFEFEGLGVTLSRAGGGSRTPGALQIKRGPDWCGRIERDGTVTSGREMSQDVIDAVERFADDPAGFAAHHGLLTGSCCFCNTPLNDERSTAMGYGPTCAKRWGLPWGKAAVAAKEVA